MGRCGGDGRDEGGSRIDFESALHLILQLFKAHLFLFELHLHVELCFLHVVVLLAGLLQFLAQLADHCLFLFKGTG